MLESFVPPIAGWLTFVANWLIPLAPVPLQNLLHYYGMIRPCFLRYSHSCGASTWISPYYQNDRFPSSIQKPVLKSCHLYAGCRQNSNQVTFWLFLGLTKKPVLTTLLCFRHFVNGSLTFISLIHTWHFLTQCLFLSAHYHGSLPQQQKVVWNLLLKIGSDGPTIIFHTALTVLANSSLLAHSWTHLCSLPASAPWRGKISSNFSLMNRWL